MGRAGGAGGAAGSNVMARIGSIRQEGFELALGL